MIIFWQCPFSPAKSLKLLGMIFKLKEPSLLATETASTNPFHHLLTLPVISPKFHKTNFYTILEIVTANMSTGTEGCLKTTSTIRYTVNMRNLQRSQSIDNGAEL